MSIPSTPWKHVSVGNNIPLILQSRSWGAALKEAEQDLEIVGLKERAHLPPVTLSGGEQQRVAIACAIVSRPDILILDELTASLDDDKGRMPNMEAPFDATARTRAQP